MATFRPWIIWIIIGLMAIVAVLSSFSLPPFMALLICALLAGAATLVVISSRAAPVSVSLPRANVETRELDSIAAGLGDAFLLYDKDFTIMYFNAAAENLFHLKAGDIVGKKVKPQDAEKPEWQRFVQVLFPSLAPMIIVKTPAGQYPQIADVAFTNPSLELRITTSPIMGDDGAVTGFMKIVRDRTREVGLLKAKNEFITVASHQLRTPMTELNWALQTLAGDETITGSNKELLQNTVVSGKKLLTLVEDLLNVSRIEEGRFGYEFEPTDIVTFLDGILESASAQARRVGIKLYFDRPKEPLPEVTIDSKKLSMVVSNLLDNAIRYNVQNGEVTLRVEPRTDGPFVEVSVKDTGIGIPAEEKEKLFTKFFRAGNAVKFQTEGSGMGLYIAKNIIQAHGGAMWVDSELNRGSVFHFTLPTDATLIPPKEVPTDYYD